MIALIAIGAWLAGAVPWFIIARRITDATARSEAQWAAERALLLDRLMARSFEQFKATNEPDAFLDANPFVPRRVLFDSTGLLEVDLEDDEGVTSGDHAGG